MMTSLLSATSFNAVVEKQPDLIFSNIHYNYSPVAKDNYFAYIYEDYINNVKECPAVKKKVGLLVIKNTIHSNSFWAKHKLFATIYEGNIKNAKGYLAVEKQSLAFLLSNKPICKEFLSNNKENTYIGSIKCDF